MSAPGHIVKIMVNYHNNESCGYTDNQIMHTLPMLYVLYDH